MRAAAAASGQLRGIARERPGAVVGVGARQLGRDVDVGQLVLDGLERADRAAEGVALERVVARHLERSLRAADLLEGEQHGRAILHSPEQALAVAAAAPSGSAGVPSKAMRACERLGSMVSTAARLTPDALRSTSASAMPRSPCATTTAMSATSPSGTGSFSPLRTPLRKVVRSLRTSALPGPLGQRQRADDLARRQLRQPGLLLRLAAGGDDGFGWRDRPRRRTAPARAREPSSSASTHRPRCPRPAPPYSSGIAAPVQPMAAISFHSALS